MTASLFLAKKKKERGGRKDEAALQSLEEELRQTAESLGLSLEQKTKGMKLRDKKVHTHAHTLDTRPSLPNYVFQLLMCSYHGTDDCKVTVN